MTEEKEAIWTSWNQNIKHHYKKLATVYTEEQLREIISESDNVRFFGNKQSSADICAGTATLIDLNSYNKILGYNDQKMEITVQTGITLKELIEAVEQKGWCIPCLPDINTVTLGGALATGTHGTSGKLLAQYVVSCRLIPSDGTVMEINEGDELMDAIRVAIGVLGVISTATIRCVPEYTLHLKEKPEKDNVWLPKIKKELKHYDFLRILWLPHTGMGYVIRGQKIDKNTAIQEYLGPKYLKHRRTASKILYKYSHKLPWTTYLANNILYQSFFRSKKEHKGSLYQATVTKSRGSTLELAEWTIALDKFPKAFEELKREINSWKNNAFIHIPMDIRFVYQDQSWLSYAYGQDTVTMGCVSRNAATADTYEAFRTIERIFLKYGGRPHWGKRFEAKDPIMTTLYPKWEAFKKLRKQLDPTNKFLNPYLSKLFNEAPTR